VAHPGLFGFGKTESQERALALIYWRLTTADGQLMKRNQSGHWHWFAGYWLQI